MGHIMILIEMCGHEKNIYNTLYRAYIFRVSTIPVLVPLTVDRFVAVVFPLKHEIFMTGGKCKIMIATTWLSLIPIVISNVMAIISKEGNQVIEFFFSFNDPKLR